MSHSVDLCLNERFDTTRNLSAKGRNSLNPSDLGLSSFTTHSPSVSHFEDAKHAAPSSGRIWLEFVHSSTHSSLQRFLLTRANDPGLPNKLILSVSPTGTTVFRCHNISQTKARIIGERIGDHRPPFVLSELTLDQLTLNSPNNTTQQPLVSAPTSHQIAKILCGASLVIDDSSPVACSIELQDWKAALPTQILPTFLK
eukprot:c7123_g1_i1.p1 GENE.c7123_g1_i1~~c7123_g1_i1.p1  ORF type:complete len:227 (+),score=23.18 c7123_g1_i1:87-683(+)